MDMSAACTKGAPQALPKASVRYYRFHVIALANEAMDAVRRGEMHAAAAAMRAAAEADDGKCARRLFRAMRKNPENWNRTQIDIMHWLRRSNLKGMGAWRLKQGLCAVYARAGANDDEATARTERRDRPVWSRRRRPEPFKRLPL